MKKQGSAQRWKCIHSLSRLPTGPVCLFALVTLPVCWAKNLVTHLSHMGPALPLAPKQWLTCIVLHIPAGAEFGDGMSGTYHTYPWHRAPQRALLHRHIYPQTVSHSLPEDATVSPISAFCWFLCGCCAQDCDVRRQHSAALPACFCITRAGLLCVIGFFFSSSLFEFFSLKLANLKRAKWK